MDRTRPPWFYERDPWYWATWEGARLAGLLAARELGFWDRLGRVEELSRLVAELVPDDDGGGRSARPEG